MPQVIPKTYPHAKFDLKRFDEFEKMGSLNSAFITAILIV